MPTRTAEATWEGNLQDGSGSMALGSGAWEGPYSFGSRFEDADGSNPEELIAAAEAGCFAMALSNALAEDGHEPERVHAEASVHLDMGEDGPEIDSLHLDVEASVPGIDEETFLEYANGAKEDCPVSRALAAIPELTMDARLA